MAGTLAFTNQTSSKFDKLMDQTYAKILRFAWGLSGNRSDAEDLTQEAFSRAYLKFTEYKGDRPFENWLYRIVVNAYIDLLRHRKRRVKTISYNAPMNGTTDEENPFFDRADPRANPEEEVIGNSMSEELRKALEVLSPDQRKLVTMAGVDDMRYSEMADAQEAPVGTIRSRLHRARKLLRKELAQYGRDYTEICSCLGLG